jgi:hypothetical protein
MKASLIALCLVACTHTALNDKYFNNSLPLRQSMQRCSADIGARILGDRHPLLEALA